MLQRQASNWPLVEKILKDIHEKEEQIAYEKDVFENNALAPCKWPIDDGGPLVETFGDDDFEIKNDHIDNKFNVELGNQNTFAISDG